MSTTATPIVKRFCKQKQTMCEYANELAYCKVTACVYLNQDTQTIKADGHGFWVEDSRNKPTNLISKKVVQDALIEKISRLNAEGEKSINIAMEFIRFKRYIDEMTPTADRPHGEWIFKDDYEPFAGEYFCSNCDTRAEVDIYGEWILSNYCPNCGAVMSLRGEEE